MNFKALSIALALAVAPLQALAQTCPTALPPSANFTGGGVTEGQFKAALTAQRDYLNCLLGATGATVDAKTALGLATVASTGAYSDLSGAPVAVPTGTVFSFAGSAAPSGYLLCYGQAVSRATYSGLFAVIGTTFGIGDGSTTFNLPDLRGRFAAGADNMGGVAANRLGSGSTGGITGTAGLGASGGQQVHTIATGELPSHNHSATSASTPSLTVSGTVAVAHNDSSGSGTINPGTSVGSVDGITFPGTFSGSVSGSVATTTSIGNTGGGAAANITPPALVMNSIIKI